MKILFIGDIFGRPGRYALEQKLSDVMRQHKVDFVVANCENAAHGRGITPKLAEDLFKLKINVLTSGNHIWDQEEIIPYIKENRRLLRPANYPSGQPGSGYGIYDDYLGIRVAVINLEGEVHMTPKDSAFKVVDQILKDIKGKADIVVVDFHAEATSEKRAMGHYLDGRVAVVVGTHTHIPTADDEIFPGGTAYLSDLGMTGSYDSVIGLDKQVAFERFIDKSKGKFKVAEGDVRFAGFVVEVSERTGRAESIHRFFDKVA